MPRRVRGAAGAVLAAGLAAGVAAAAPGAGYAPEDMNILVIGVEDWTPAAIGCYGNDRVRTPAVDALAARGVRFTRAYCQATVCQPSRASLVTGLRPDATRVYHNAEGLDEFLPEGTPFIAGILGRRPGAWTAKVGKLVHLDYESVRYVNQFDQVELADNPDHFGRTVRYDVVSGGYLLPTGRPPRRVDWTYSPDPEMDRELLRLEAERDAILATGVKSTWPIRKPFQSLLAEQVGDSGRHPEHDQDGVIAATAAAMLRDFAARRQPFFLHVGFYATHTPLRAPREFCDLYDPDDMPMPAAPRSADRGVPEVAVRNGANYDIFNQLEQTPARVRAARAAYYACASYVDWCIGQLDQALRESGLRDNTIVVLYADHGFHLGEHGCWSKFTLFEQSTRIPLIVAVPGLETAGRTCDGIVELVDLLPTLCDLWGLDALPGFEGTSFRPLLADPDRAWKRAAFSVITLGGLGRSVRTPRYRYAEYRADRSLPGEGPAPFAVELYDLDRDPWEQHNLGADPAYRATRDELAALLRAGWKAALPPGPDGAPRHD